MKQELSIILSFLKDKLSLLMIFVINTAVIILFFNLSLDSREWIYPCLLSAVIFSPFLLIQYISYRKLMLICDIGDMNIPDEVYSNKLYIKKVNSTLSKIHKHYNVKLNEEKQKNLEFRRFISQFIHAMKTPVTVINLAVQNIPEVICGNGPECLLDGTIRDISDENKRQLEMLDNLLDYLRINEFSKDYRPVTVELCSELIKIINGKKRSFIYNNVRPNLILNGIQKAEIITDAKWNSVMLEQIISNAIKYSDTSISNGSEEMKIIDFEINRKDNRIVLTITDYGIGIPAHDLQRIMDPFFTGENGRKMKNATGIGLYIVKLISQGLGHEVVVESQQGVGTRVSIIYNVINQN